MKSTSEDVVSTEQRQALSGVELKARVAVDAVDGMHSLVQVLDVLLYAKSH